MTALHQFVPTYAARHAIGNHVLEAAKTIRAMGMASEIYVESGAGKYREVQDWRRYPGPQGQPTWLLYQLSTGSQLADVLRARPEPLLVNYHNITPPAYVAPWDPPLLEKPSSVVAWGRRQLGELAADTELGIAVSRFNEAELVAAGYGRTAVVPVLVDLEALGAVGDGGADRRLVEAKRGGGADWLFVGRISANKCQHEVVKAFAVYRRLYDPRARLWLVGGVSSQVYWDAVAGFVDALGLAGVVTMTGSVPQEVLVSHYRHADVFVCLSEHEGFCVPLVEAMWHRVPIVALAAAAVPETLGSAGVSLPFVGGRQPAPAVVAAAVHRVLEDGSVHDRLVGCGSRRVEQFSLARTRRQFADALLTVVDRP